MNSNVAPDKMLSPERLDEVAVILASAVVRLWAKHAGAPEKREFCRDNCLEVPTEISPHAIKT